MAGLRHRRTGYFVQIPRETIRNRRLSYKERGLLGFILDQPPGWEPTIEKLVAASDDDGKTAVTSGVLKLREEGYYRLERRRRLDGTFEWGAAVSEVAVPSWAAEHAAYGGKPIPLVEQVDHSFKVRLPDGSLTDDGFEDVPERDRPSGTLTGTVVASSQVGPEAGFPVVGNPLAGNPLAGNEASKEEGTTTRESSSLRDEAAPCGDALAQQEPTLNQRVDALVKAWWEWRKANRPHTLPTQGVPAIKGMVKTALQNGKPERLVGQAMSRLADQALPFSGGTLQTAIKEAALLPDSPSEWRIFAGEDATDGGRRGATVKAIEHVARKQAFIETGRKLDAAMTERQAAAGGAW